MFLMHRKRILVAMSGGVDSATTAAILKNQGHEVIGVTMQLWDYGEAEGGCCSADEVCDARRVAHDLGIPHYVVNYMDEFRRFIVSDFVEKYENGKTPVPCILCNQFMKFDFLLNRALELGADSLATGHYARILKNGNDNRLTLAKGVDENKDQSYFLFTLKNEHLKRLMFPLGDKTKPEVREIARSLGVKTASKSESMGVCFITGSSYREFLEPYTKKGREQGDILDTEGNYLGQHDGISNYTVGQRRGLGIAAGKPMYVVKVDPKNNIIVLGEEKDLYRSGLKANNISWVNPPDSGEIRVKAKIRYRHNGDKATVTIAPDNTARIFFDEPQRAITPGQAVVFYNEEKLLGGGWISEVF